LKLLLIVNTSASSVTARARVVIQKSLSADHEVTVAETSRRGHATRLAQGAAAKGTDAVIVLGGDGTLNEAANGLAHTDCALGVLPGGSTNVFARTIGMTNDPIEATGELLSALGPGFGGIQPAGLGNVNGRRYLFHVGVGFDAAVVAQVEKRSTLKRYLGHAFFAYAAVDTWARHYDRRKPHFAVSLQRRNGEEINVSDGYLALVLNTNPYTFLGERPFDVAPGTGLDTPLAALVVRSLGAVTMLGLVASALRRDRGIGNHRKVTLATDVVRATVTPRTTVPYQVDGDYLGEADRLEFTWEPESLRLIVPHQPEPDSWVRPGP
jgi:diacylglycerol kinase family enzyme